MTEASRECYVRVSYRGIYPSGTRGFSTVVLLFPTSPVPIRTVTARVPQHPFYSLWEGESQNQSRETCLSSSANGLPVTHTNSAHYLPKVSHVSAPSWKENGEISSNFLKLASLITPISVSTLPSPYPEATHAFSEILRQVKFPSATAPTFKPQVGNMQSSPPDLLPPGPPPPASLTPHPQHLQ